MPVDTEHKDYRAYYNKWQLVRSIVNNDAKEYIRFVDISDKTRSEQYREDAVLTNFTSLTKNGLTGLVFRKPPMIELPSELNYLFDDVTGDNLSLNQFSQKSLSELLQTGRYGILIDYPPVEEVSSLKDLDADDAPVARFKPYVAESIINHKMKYVGSKCKLSLIVLHELIEDPDNIDKFESPMIDRFRVLELDGNGFYKQTVYNKQSEIVEGPIYPVKSDGELWDEIPFQFFGSENNDSEYDPIPLYDLATINLGHYRNSADYEESIFVCGQPMGVWSIEGSKEEFEAANPGGIRWGSRSGVNVGEKGSGALLQANPNQLADSAMARKEAQAAALGARMITPPHGRETAEGARIRYGSQNSALYNITINMSLAMLQCLEWASDFMGADYTQVKFKLNDVFYDDSTDPQMLMAMMQGYDRGFVLANEVRAYMRETGAAAYLDSADGKALNNLHILDPMNPLDTDMGNKIAAENAKSIAPSTTDTKLPGITQ